jgi:hypothetical protein
MTTDRQTRSGWGGFTGAYGSVEKDMVTYGSETCGYIRMTRGSFGRDMVWYAYC